ncbi:MAG TPA: polyprenyl synthetase family protein [Patescibacteria group bacterium]|nr:polyprenyl synthetase family protein [Patescibacteria group bacterium]
MPQDFQQVLAEKREIVWQEIQKYLKTPRFPGKIAIPPKYQKEMDFHWQIVRTYPERLGKYLRPTLVLLTAEAMGVPEEKAIRTAAAMQTSEDWILIHDDFEDGSLARRGDATLHRLYGEELAVNAGDGLHIVMWKMLWDNRRVLGEKKAEEVTEEFYQMLTRTIFGQAVEIKWTKDNRQDLTDEDIFLILDGKTSYYTIAGPMRLGAILGGATAKQLEALWEFGQLLGRCFQITDDLLDLTSDFRGLKKQIGNDIYEGKRTIMLMHLFRKAKGKDKEKLSRIMRKGREEKTETETEWIINQMKECGSLDYGRRIAQDLATKALEAFETKLDFLRKQPARDQLKAGIDFILKRDF